MPADIRIAFASKVILLPLASILPLKQVPDTVRRSVRYRRIATSIAEVGVIEPIVVAAQGGDSNQYLLLDGHLRYSVLLERGDSETLCLLADDDEAFTYNKRVNRLSTVQEHFMLVRALEKGVSEEKLARALDVDVKFIKRRRTMLDGIQPEVVEMLKDHQVSAVTFEALRKMKALRQIEVAELMTSTGNFSATYAQALLIGTRQADLAKSDQPKSLRGMSPEQMARMEREMESLQLEFKAVDTTYGDDVLALVIATGYLSKLVANKKVERYLAQNHSEILGQFKAIIAAASLDHDSAAAA
ncbi:plasmid partitioning protein RepB C-terminal domain-containing protein [Reyranella massiliensis]|uniref:plasmid partitioning protein RepB C-terminal domain-containing protein n=1 Tax=Reyranella massiliensis TaxID=445220 RepID=UPI0002DD531C|nr:plasmid partitioning protein RepB C-terminal domain-containing protein [Reyranella massiliensis]